MEKALRRAVEHMGMKVEQRTLGARGTAENGGGASTKTKHCDDAF